MLDVYLRMDEDALRQQARYHQGACDDGDMDVSDLRWTLVADLPLAVLENCLFRSGHVVPVDAPRQWTSWFHQECEMLAEEIGDASDWERLSVQEILEPVVVTVEADRVQIWDGWHRIGASFAAGRTTIPAIVGVRPDDFGRDPMDVSTPFRSSVQTDAGRAAA